MPLVRRVSFRLDSNHNERKKNVPIERIRNQFVSVVAYFQEKKVQFSRRQQHQLPMLHNKHFALLIHTANLTLKVQNLQWRML